MSQSYTIDFHRPIALFPLADCVLLPHATVPLHVFEHRYREMVSDALAGDTPLIAMATFEGAGWKKDYHNKPAIRRFVCVGGIVRHVKLPDGRYNILLQGICRARINEEIEHDPYRLAMLEPVEAVNTMEIDLDEHRERIEQMLEDEHLKRLAAVGAIKNWLNREIPTSVMVDLAVLTICRDVESRYYMLSEPDALERARWLEQYLMETRQTLKLAARQGSGVSEEGWPIN